MDLAAVVPNAFDAVFNSNNKKQQIRKEKTNKTNDMANMKRLNAEIEHLTEYINSLKCEKPDTTKNGRGCKDCPTCLEVDKIQERISNKSIERLMIKQRRR